MIDPIGRAIEMLAASRANVGTLPRIKYYVDHSRGNANYDGLSRLSAMVNIQDAIDTADDGDLIHIAEDTYDEAISIPAGKNGLQIICDPGVYLINTTPGTVVAIASDVVSWKGGIIETAGQVGMAINGDWFRGEDIRVYNSSIGFDMNGAHPLMKNCWANECSASGFDISEDSGIYVNCAVHGAAASRGFYLSNANADHNMFLNPVTLNCTAAGYETVAGADENIFYNYGQSDLCAGPTDAGTNNTWIEAGAGGVTPTLHGSGTQAAVITTEHTLTTAAVPGRFTLHVDTANMAAGDVLFLRIYEKVLTGGSTTGVVYFTSYSGAQLADLRIKVSEVVRTDLEEANALIFTLQQTEGTGRNFPWKVVRE